MRLDRKQLTNIANENGFIRDTLEKVFRLVEILKYINSHPLMKDSLTLKGGTAINLVVFNLPRLSVDLDYDYCKITEKDIMLMDRQIIFDDINKYMISEGYLLLPNSKEHHALHSMIYGYSNTAGMNDNIKIEINYSLRNHIFTPTLRKINANGLFKDFETLCLINTELFGSKIKALLDRTTPRDLYDIDNMIYNTIFSGEDELKLLRKSVVFYMAIGNKVVPNGINPDIIDDLTWHRIKLELNPVIRKTEKFNLDSTKQRVKNFLSDHMKLDEQDLLFLEAFRHKEYRPELLFDDDAIINRIESHPMALWKCSTFAK